MEAQASTGAASACGKGRAMRAAVVAAAAPLAALSMASAVLAEELGSVNTNFRVTGSDRVVVEAYDDPAVPGITCYVSRARTGGIKGAIGMAEDPAEASIACRQVGPVSFPSPLPRQDSVFSERMSVLFKALHVVRMVDGKRNTLIYMTYSDRIVSGSPQNSVSAVPIDRATPIPVK